ncbi:response regulator transcription factor [Alkalilimnicola ehrlichii MLHE-1]|uniref:Two component transcriptional regulator, winged helix family n=1 Tax=Alkalilimnicola ehrlichii (strain ATCC BAA-1101 / DSM 17681 / MLHE-1) TaxID=187272 RepID=Q0A5P2_ALKEH|nr:response regulator transcription factor [Alkalilimnicola ehrlichii]ABI57845.1 two component transcriptional regulator, winged helix family [Alkalilimnicola ehrlichii MLHE-1]
MRLLVVEDEPALRRQLADALGRAGYVVDQAADGREGLHMARDYPLDLAIIDLGLPRFSGLELIRALRADGRTLPVLVLTARGHWQDRVTGLEAGADDYLVKPFEMPELLARVQALLRRAGGWADPVLRCPPLALDTRSQTAWRDGARIELTGSEFRLLHYMMLHQGAVLSKTRLEEHLYPDAAEHDSNVMEVFIRRLRRKLDPDGTLQPIETLRGRGYRLRLARAG